jgi:hypothetical protein
MLDRGLQNKAQVTPPPRTHYAHDRRQALVQSCKIFAQSCKMAIPAFANSPETINLQIAGQLLKHWKDGSI